MLLAIFSPIQKSFGKFLKYQEVKTDNAVFRLHCILTVAVLIGSSLVLTTVQLVGSPIKCVTTSSKRTEDWAKAIETWCWVNSTYSMPVDIQKEVIHPGVMYDYDIDEPKTFYTYYQWVCFVLFLQGICCYLPKMLWDYFENGLLTKLTTGLHGICPTEEKEKRTDNIICYLQRYKNEHMFYVLVYWFCEALCLLNLLFQMWLMNVFLGGHLLSYGLKGLHFSEISQYDRNDPLIYIFPRMTKCTFYYGGPSGGLVNLDCLCMLPQNIINEKIYIIMWFWFIILSCLFALILLYRAVLVTMPRLRPRLLVAKVRCISIADAAEVSSNLDLGDWWLFYMLAKNIDPLAYRGLLTDYIKREKKSSLFK